MDINKQRTNMENDGFGPDVPKTDVRKLKEGESIQGQLIGGPITRHLLWWATIVDDRQSGKEKQTWRMASVNKDDTTPLDILAAADRCEKHKIVVDLGGDTSQVRSRFDRSKKYYYSWINRSCPEGAKVEVLDVPWSVIEEIRGIRQAINKATNTLVHGLSYMYDINISVSINQKTGRRKYNVQPVANQMAGKIPANYLDEETFPITDRGGYYTKPGDIELIINTPWELEEVDPPISVEQVLERMQNFPIDLSRKDKKDQTRFVYFNSSREYEAIIKVVSNPDNAISYLPAMQNEVSNLSPGHGNPNLAQLPATGGANAVNTVQAEGAVVENADKEATPAVANPAPAPSVPPVAPAPAPTQAPASVTPAPAPTQAPAPSVPPVAPAPNPVAPAPSAPPVAPVPAQTTVPGVPTPEPVAPIADPAKATPEQTNASEVPNAGTTPTGNTNNVLDGKNNTLWG